MSKVNKGDKGGGGNKFCTVANLFRIRILGCIGFIPSSTFSLQPTKLASHGGDRKGETYKDQAGCPLDFVIQYSVA